MSSGPGRAGSVAGVCGGVWWLFGGTVPAVTHVLALVAVSMAVVLAAVAPWLGVLVPFVAALVMKANARVGVKLTVPFVLTVLIAVASLATDDWHGLTWNLARDRVLQLFGEAQATHIVVRALVQRFTPHDSINDLVAPDKGVG
jgi:hypothetical protein